MLLGCLPESTADDDLSLGVNASQNSEYRSLPSLSLSYLYKNRFASSFDGYTPYRFIESMISCTPTEFRLSISNILYASNRLKSCLNASDYLELSSSLSRLITSLSASASSSSSYLLIGDILLAVPLTGLVFAIEWYFSSSSSNLFFRVDGVSYLAGE